MIELVMVIMIIAILAVFAVPKWTSPAVNANYEAYLVLNDIRYAQALSVNSGLRYRWVKVSSSSYQIVNSLGAAIMLPGGNTTVTLTSGVTIGALGNLPNGLIAFDPQGIPYTDTATPGTPLAATATIPISGGGQSRTIQINQDTGYGVVS